MLVRWLLDVHLLSSLQINAGLGRSDNLLAAQRMPHAKNTPIVDIKEIQTADVSGLDFLWSGLLDSNQRPRAPQTCALPTALNPDPCIRGVPHFAGAKVVRFAETAKYFCIF